MQSFTKIEIEWIATALEERAEQYKTMFCGDEKSSLKSLCNLRAEQMTDCAKKLRRSIDTADKRIEIKY